MATKRKSRLKVSDQVRAAIDRSGLTRYAIGKATGIDHGTISRFMSGKGGLSTEGLDAIGELIGLNVTISKQPRK